MTVYRRSPNRLDICKFVNIMTHPATENRLNAGMINHGKAEKRQY